MVVDDITAALKQALLAHDSETVTTLRSLKSAVLNAEIAAGKRETGLPESEVVGLIQKEAKKRQESANIYRDAGDDVRADKELSEKKIIDQYLPTQLDEAVVLALVNTAIAELGATTMADMGKVIGAVKAKAGASADGSVIAKLVKEKLSA
jgi:uncharacterized protein YqeY